MIHQFTVDKTLVGQMTGTAASFSKRNIAMRESFRTLLSYVQSGQMNGMC